MSASYAELKELNGNVLHPMSVPALDGERPLFMARGQGVRVFDSEGKAYLDGWAGFGASTSATTGRR